MGFTVILLLMKKRQICIVFLVFLTIGLSRDILDITRPIKSYDPFLEISNIDYFQTAYYEENWAKKKVVSLRNTTLVYARMYADQYVAVVELPDGPPTVTRADLHAVAPLAIREVPSGSKSAKLQLGDETCTVRAGTALMTSGNFMVPNGWHQMVSFHAHWQALKTTGIDKVDYLVLFSGTRFPNVNSPYSEAYKIFYRNGFRMDTKKHQCYKRIIFTDLAPHRRSGWVGGMWNLAGYNGRFRDTMLAHPRYVDEYRRMQSEILQAVEPRARRTGNHTLCYMKRTVGGTRGFQTAMVENGFVDLFKPNLIMDFAPGKPPAHQQVRTMNQCNTLTGTHGAGLGYMIWADKGLNVVEMGDGTACRGYYKHMAQLLGHRYACVPIGSLGNPQLTELWKNHLSPSVLQGKTSLKSPK